MSLCIDRTSKTCYQPGGLVSYNASGWHELHSHPAKLKDFHDTATVPMPRQMSLSTSVAVPRCR